MSLNWQLDEETEKHMNDALKEERDNPPPPEPASGPSTPAVTVEKEEPKVEAKVEEKTERPRNPDGTFAKAESKDEVKEIQDTVKKELQKPVEPPEGFVAHGAFHEERQR